MLMCMCVYNLKVAATAAGGKQRKRTFSERALVKKNKKNTLSIKHEKVNSTTTYINF